MNNSESFLHTFGNGEDTMFELFFRMEFHNIVHFLTAYIKDVSVAEDLAQDSFISLWNKRRGLDPNCNIRGYLFTIARNKALNYIRDNRLCDRTPDRQNFLIDYYALSHYSVTQEIDALSLEKLITKTYDSMPGKMKKVFFMNRELGLTYKEIATKETLSIKSVEYLIAKALAIFRKRLRHFMPVLVPLSLFSGYLVSQVY